MPESELLTAEEAAVILKLHPVTVRRLLREKQIPGVKLGKRQWRISRTALEEYTRGTQPDQSQ